MNNSDRIEPTTLCFAAACFRFSYWGQGTDQLDGEQLLTRVRKAIESLPAVNNVEAEPCPVPLRHTDFSSARPSLESGEPVVSADPSKLDFDLYIPARVQDQLVDDKTSKTLGTERFRVHTRFGYYGEVAFIQPLDAPNCRKPSLAVRVVREFLFKNFADPEKRVKFEWLGPSPFHANFFMQFGPADADADITLQLSRKRGYADYLFNAKSESFSSPRDALDALLFLLSSELSAYYEIVRRRRATTSEWEVLEHSLSSLLADDTQSSDAQPKLHRSLESTLKDLTRFEIQQVYLAAKIKQILRDLYKADDEAFLRDFIDTAINELPTFPTDQIGRVLAFHQNKQQKRLELLVAVLCALIGGIAGSLLTLAAGK